MKFNSAIKACLLALIFLAPIVGFGQNKSDTTAIAKPKKESYWKLLKYDTKTTAQGIGHAFTQPLRWKGKDFLKAGGFVAGTGLLYMIDYEAQEYFLKRNEHVPEFFKDFGWYGGSPQNFFMVTGSIYGIGLFTRNEKIRHTGVLIIASAAATGIIQSLTKTIVGRARPTNETGKSDFKFWSHEAAYHSFPSGHAVLAFSLSHAVAKQFKSIWAKIPIYAVGSILPLSRLWANAHWISDIGVGIGLSIFVVDGIDNFLKKEQKYDFGKPKQITWRLNAGVGTIGLVGTF